MSIRIAINGFGRIGRDVLRASRGRDALDISLTQGNATARASQCLTTESIGALLSGRFTHTQ